MTHTSGLCREEMVLRRFVTIFCLYVSIGTRRDYTLVSKKGRCDVVIWCWHNFCPNLMEFLKKGQNLLFREILLLSKGKGQVGRGQNENHMREVLSKNVLF